MGRRYGGKHRCLEFWHGVSTECLRKTYSQITMERWHLQFRHVCTHNVDIIQFTVLELELAIISSIMRVCLTALPNMPESYTPSPSFWKYIGKHDVFTQNLGGFKFGVEETS